MTVRQCVQNIYRTSGILGFYKGITASYFGISETVIHFVIYEAIKAKIVSLDFFTLLLDKIHYFISSCRMMHDERIPATARRQGISSSLCWPVPYRRRLHHASRIRMRWRERGSVKRAPNTVDSGKRCTPFGSKKANTGCIGMLRTFYTTPTTLSIEFQTFKWISHFCSLRNRGLATQLVRQIPNTAIMMATYEAVVYILTRHFNTQFYDGS